MRSLPPTGAHRSCWGAWSMELGRLSRNPFMAHGKSQKSHLTLNPCEAESGHLSVTLNCRLENPILVDPWIQIFFCCPYFGWLPIFYGKSWLVTNTCFVGWISILGKNAASANRTKVKHFGVIWQSFWEIFSWPPKKNPQQMDRNLQMDTLWWVIHLFLFPDSHSCAVRR